ncbi:MAG: dockerin type I repeat-containing protein [Pseudobutyrivibrio sp.]|nr:dockerin type I repeat-containing protein [Pseudobutyrivibrio sp.]
MKKMHRIMAIATSLAISVSLTTMPALAYVRFEGTLPDTTGKTLSLVMTNTDNSLSISGIVKDGIFDDYSDLYGMKTREGIEINASNLQEIWVNAHSHNPQYKWGDWTYGTYELTCVYNDGSQDAVWEFGAYRVMPDFPVEKEVTDCGHYENFGTENQKKISDRGDYHFCKQADGTLKWTNGIYNHKELDVPYTVLATKMECVTYVRNDAEPMPIDTHVYKTITERDMYLSSFRTFSNAYSLVYEGEFAVPTLYEFSQTKLDDSFKNQVIHYRLIDFYDTHYFEDGYITFGEDGLVQERYVERSGEMGPPDAGLILLTDETPQKNEYFWPKEVEVTRLNENGVEVHDSTMKVPQPKNSGVIVKGDVNVDGKVNHCDLVIFKKFVLGNNNLKLGTFLNSDMNSDGQVDEADYELLKQSVK